MSRFTSLLRKNFVILFVLAAIFSFTSCEEPNVEVPSDEFKTPTITGKVCIPEGMDIEPSDVSIKVVSEGVTRKIEPVMEDGTYVIGGLEEGKKYTLCFSTEIQSPDTARALDAAPVAAATTTRGFGGWLDNLIPGTDMEHADCGNIYMKPLGTIKGKAVKKGAEDNFEIDVYIPGTSYIAKTAKDGSFAIYNVPQGTHIIRFASNGYIARMEEGVILSGPDYVTHPEKEMKTVELIKNVGTVSGKITLSGETSHEGIALTLEGNEDLPSRTMNTSADGAYRISDVVPGTYSLLITKEGYITQKVNDITVKANKDTPVAEVTLQKQNTTVTGTFKLNGMTDHTGIQVLMKAADGSDSSYPSSTDKDGKFVINNVRPGSYRITAFKENYANITVDIHVSIESGNDAGTYTLENATRSLSGFVKDKYGNPISGVDILATNIYDNKANFISRTNERGYYSLSGMVPGTYVISYSLEGYQNFKSRNISVESDVAHNMNDVVLTRANGDISGTLDFGINSVPANITVILKNSSDIVVESAVINTAEFRFDDIKPGAYTVTVSVEDYAIVSMPVAVRADDTTSVSCSMTKSVGKLSGNITLSGEVVFDRITVSITGDGLPARTVPVNEVGAYSIDRIVPGTYSVSVSRDGYVTYTETVYIGAGEEKTVSTELIKASGIITGRAILEGTADYAGINVIAGNINTGKTYSVSTDDQGIFNIYNVTEEGTYSLLISKDGYISDTAQTVDVRFNSTAVVTPVILKNVFASVSGTVKLGEGATPIGVSILLKEQVESNPASYPITTDSEGKYSIGKVKPGTYTLFVSHSGYESKTLTDIVIAESSDNTMLPVTLPVGIRSVTGKVNLELRTDNAGALVTATNTSDGSLVYSAITNTDGNYTLAGMKSGQYNIVITAADYNTVTLPTVDITEGALLDLGLTEVSITKGFITGMVDLEGRNNDSGVKVYLVGTDYVVETDAKGVYTFNVPAGNYPGGLRFEHDYYKVASHVDTLTVLKNSTFGVQEKKLTALYSDVSGKIIVEGTGNADGVTVSLAGQTVVTGTDGVFSFSKVPVGMQAIKLERLNTPTIESEISVYPAESVVLDAYRMIPDSATIKGYVKLDGMATHEGVEIKLIERTTGRTYSTKSNTTGYFNISNVNTSGIYDVTFTKNGWESCAPVVLDNLKSLETRNLGNINVLNDIAEPIIEKVEINGGIQTSNNTKVSIRITADEFGSGIKAMRYSWNGGIDSAAWQIYKPVFDTVILDDTNGEKTLSVQLVDNAGNISDIRTSSIILTDQIRSMSGTLSGPDLEWHAAENPYVINGDIVIREGDILKIDPGVQVLINGNYGIDVYGTVMAIGSVDKKIVFRSSGKGLPDGVAGYDGDWNGLNVIGNNLKIKKSGSICEYIEGSILRNCEIENLKNGITGEVYIDSCNIISGDNAIGNASYPFSGIAVDCGIIGNVYSKYNIKSATVKTTLLSCTMKNSDGSYWSTMETIDTDLFNNLIEGYDEFVYRDDNIEYCAPSEIHDYFLNNTLRGCNKIRIVGNKYNSEIAFNSYENIQSPMSAENVPSVILSNLDNNLINPIVSMDSGTKNNTYDYKYNYWGYEHTIELDSISGTDGNQNVSFLYDCFDNPDLGLIDWSCYRRNTIDYAGYMGDGYMRASCIPAGHPYVGVVGDPLAFVIDVEGDAIISEYRIANSPSTFLDSEWKTYKNVAILPYENIDENQIVDMFTKVYVQGKTTDGKLTPCFVYTIGYSNPIIFDTSIAPGEIIREDNVRNMLFYFMTPFYNGISSISGNVAVLDYGENISHLVPTEVKNGKHEVVYYYADELGNHTECVVPFTINRLVPSLKNSVFDTSDLNVGDVRTFNLTFNSAKYMTSYRIYGNDNLMYEGKVAKGSSVCVSNCSIKYDQFPVGTVDLYVEMQDSAGNISKERLGCINVLGEVIAPSLSGISINDKQVLDGNTPIPLGLEVFDEGGVRDIVVSLNGLHIYEKHSRFYSDSLRTVIPEICIDPKNWENGKYVLDIMACDFAGNEVHDVRTFVIDRVIPFGNADIKVFDNQLNVDINITNAEYLWNVDLLVDGNLAYTELPFRDNGAATFASVFNISLNDLPHGTHEVIVIAKDIAGNRIVLNSYTLDVPGIEETLFGLGLTWAEDGSLLVDGSTRVLMNFNDPLHPGKESISGLSWTNEKLCTDRGLGIGSFDGDSIYNTVNIDFVDRTWTFEFWAQLTSGNGFSMSFNDLLRGIQMLSVDNRGYIHGYLNYSDLNDENVRTETDIELMNFDKRRLSEWHHYAFVSDGYSFRAYVDGMLFVEFDSKLMSDFCSVISINGKKKDYFDEFRVSDKARSQDEIFNYVQYVRNNNLIR